MNKSGEIWVVDDDRSIRWVLERALQKAGMKVRSFGSADPVLVHLRGRRPDAIVSDIRMPGISGLHFLEQIQTHYPEIPIIIMTAYSDLDNTVVAYQRGAFEYLPKPFDVDEAVTVVRRALTYRREKQAELTANKPSSLTKAPMGGILGSAPAMQEVFRAIGRLSRTDMTVLITGESGTGKALVARALHGHSPRAAGPFVALHPSTIAKEHLGSELFGHEYLPSPNDLPPQWGRFEQAQGGTLFLDEIGDMSGELQAKLLHVLTSGEFHRIGGQAPILADVRIIATTHQNLEERVRDDLLREDLYHRLNVIRIHVPALRERRTDITTLAHHFLAATAEEMGLEPKVLHSSVERILIHFDWPGNVRQLENTCRWLTVMASGSEVHVEDLPSELVGADLGPVGQASWENGLARWADECLSLGDTRLLDDALPRFEKILIKAALNFTGGRRRDAAILLGWGRNTLTRKLKELALESDPSIE